MKIVIYGAESTGKTTLSQALAKHYDTAWVPEFARKYLQKKYNESGEICSIEDLIPIAQGQIKEEQKAEKNAQNGLLFCDTNPYQTYYYGKAYYKNFEYPELWALAERQNYDFYLLTYIDTPWIPDDLRDRPDEREEMHRFFENSLIDNNFPYITLKGSREERLQKAIKKIDQLMASQSKKN